MFTQLLGSAPLFMEDLFFKQMAPFIIPIPNSKHDPIDFLNKQKKIFETEEKAFLCNRENELQTYNSEHVTNNEAFLFVLNVTGVMFPWKYQYYRDVLSQADLDPNVIGIVIKFETPGGAGYDLNETSLLIENLSKPYYPFIKCACSAGYWLASANPKKITIASETAIAGSIGSMVKYTNYDGYTRDVLKSKTETIYADASSEKNNMGRKMEKGDDSAYKEWLNFHNNFFLAHVEKYRGIKKNDDVAKGGIYYGEKAVDFGLADAVMDENEFFDMVRVECSKHALK